MSNKTETYTLVINSATSTAISGNIDNRNYFVQWESVLPKKYNKYFVELNFMSAGSATVAPSLLSVGMNQSNTVELIGSNFCVWIPCVSVLMNRSLLFSCGI